MSLIKQLIPTGHKYFTPASAEVNWTRIETLVHGPGASEAREWDANTVVFACLMAIATAYTEPPLRVSRTVDDNPEAQPDHPLQALLDKPSGEGAELDIDELLFWTAWAKHVDGNAYWLKMRSGNPDSGNVVQLWPVSPRLMEPFTEIDPRTGRPDAWISYYKYRIAPNETIAVPVQNVVHFRLGLDDHDMRKGLSPLKALARVIATDEEADRFIEALLRNYAVPGLVVIPTAGTMLTPEDADRLTDKLRYKFGGDNRGNIAVLSKETKVEQFGFSPAELDMTIMHRIPEERISAVLGVPAIVAGLGAGLDRATYTNSRELREMFTEQKLVPLWRSDAAKINASLTPDFASNGEVYVEFDISNVRALQEDEDAKYLRLTRAVGKPFLTRNEARSEIGFDPVDEWEEADISPTVPPQFEDSGGDEGVRDREVEDDERDSDLRKWRTKALKAVRAGRPGAVKFESDQIPLALQASIAGALEGTRTAEEVEAVFNSVWLGYP